MSNKVAVIGGGIGGLSAAIRLASKDWEVDLYEQNNLIGGKANIIEENGFRFDTGPSLITMPEVIRELFEFAGEDSNDYLTFCKLEILCRYFYKDGTILDAYQDINKFSLEIEAKTSEKKESLLKFQKYCADIYLTSADVFLFNEINILKLLFSFKALKSLFSLKKMDVFRTMDKAVRSFFKDEKIIQLFNRYATYTGSSPYKIPATLNQISYVENTLGGYYIEGGMYKLVSALEKLAVKKGVNILTDNKVDKILFRNTKITGLKVNGDELDYETIISNSDVMNTCKNLLRDFYQEKKMKYERLEPSSSAIVFYWGVKIDSTELKIHNILFASDYKKEFDSIFEKKICSDDLTIYIYISSKLSSEDSPQGYENWFVMVNAPYDNGQNWDTELKAVRSNIIKTINERLRIDIDDKIVFEKFITPKDIMENTSSNRGSIYGISSNNKMAAFFRQENKSKDIDGLYFCGGSAHPGGGIPLVILSGKNAAELILKNEKQF